MTAEAATTPSVVGTVLDNNPEVTRSYSEAIINAATKDGSVEAVLDDLDGILSSVLKTNPRLGTVLGSPLIPAAEKDRLILKVFDGRALPTVVRFLRVLNRHGRLGSLRDIAQAARTLWDKRSNRREVLVRSAIPLDDGQRAALNDRLARLLNATPVVKLVVDPTLIGGLVVQVGDDVYDASVRNRLEQLRQRLMEGKMHGKIQS